MLLEYLKNNKFNKQLENLKKKLSGKKIMIYGAGKMFEEIVKNYDLSGLNIIGVTDIRFQSPQPENEIFGYKICYYTNFLNEDFDVLLIATKIYDGILKEYKNERQIVLPLCKQNLKYFIENKLQSLPKILTKALTKIMPKRKPKRYNNNVILIKQNGKKIYNPKIKNLSINFLGDNNTIELYEPFEVQRKFSISVRNNNKIIFDKNCKVSKMEMEFGNDNQFLVGNNNWFCNVQLWNYYLNDTTITIGNGSMLSYAVEIKATDAHTVYDMETHEVLNPPKDIKIGNHVWIGRGCFIMKGAIIPDNCIVGANSLINKEFTEENCIIAGSPAKIVKRGINWDRKSPQRPIIS